MKFPSKLFNEIKKKLKILYFSCLNLVHNIPLISEILGTPKGFYTSTKDYWITNFKKSSEEYQNNFISLYPKIYAQRKPPKTIEKDVHWKFEIEFSHEHPETFVTLIPQGRIWGHNATIITPDNKFLSDVSFEIGTNLNEHSILKQWKLPKSHYIDGNVAVLSAAGGTSFFHWMFDVLPRIHLLQESGIDFNDIDKFLVNSCHFSFQQETLKILGISEKKIIESCNYTHIKAKKLIVPSLPGQTGNIPKWACEFLRNKILSSDSFKRTEHKKHKHIYISRDQAVNRRITNEQELLIFLKKFNFETIFLEGMSVIEQASVINSASVIVAPHGAGLSNLVFAAPHTKVIELFSPNYVNVCYWVLSNQFELDYYYLIGQGKKPDKYDDPHLMAENILVDIEALEELFIKYAIIDK